MAKIFIDPGHGGKDPGAMANGLQEKNIVLDIAKRTVKLLQEFDDVQVKLSRSDDRYIDLAERARLANEWGADYFVSIHVNSGNGSGYEDFIYSGRVANEAVQNQHVMNEEIVKATGSNNRGKKRANFAVLRQSKMPAILTENGFIDGRDAQLLKQSVFIEKIARGHVNGLVKIFNLKKNESSLERLGPFKDVPSDYWAVDAINYVKESGLMIGHSDGRFAPDEVVTRAQLAQVLYNLSQKIRENIVSEVPPIK